MGCDDYNAGVWQRAVQVVIVSADVRWWPNGLPDVMFWFDLFFLSNLEVSKSDKGDKSKCHRHHHRSYCHLPLSTLLIRRWCFCLLACPSSPGDLSGSQEVGEILPAILGNLCSWWFHFEWSVACFNISDELAVAILILPILVSS